MLTRQPFQLIALLTVKKCILLEWKSWHNWSLWIKRLAKWIMKHNIYRWHVSQTPQIFYVFFFFIPTLSLLLDLSCSCGESGLWQYNKSRESIICRTKKYIGANWPSLLTPAALSFTPFHTTTTHYVLPRSHGLDQRLGSLCHSSCLQLLCVLLFIRPPALHQPLTPPPSLLPHPPQTSNRSPVVSAYFHINLFFPLTWNQPLPQPQPVVFCGA